MKEGEAAVKKKAGGDEKQLTYFQLLSFYKNIEVWAEAECSKYFEDCSLKCP